MPPSLGCGRRRRRPARRRWSGPSCTHQRPTDLIGGHICRGRAVDGHRRCHTAGGGGRRAGRAGPLHRKRHAVVGHAAAERRQRLRTCRRALRAESPTRALGFREHRRIDAGGGLAVAEPATTDEPGAAGAGARRGCRAALRKLHPMGGQACPVGAPPARCGFRRGGARRAARRRGSNGAGGPATGQREAGRCERDDEEVSGTGHGLSRGLEPEDLPGGKLRSSEEGVCPAGSDAVRSPRHGFDRNTYPTPRTVWMRRGSPAASVLRRR